MKFFLAFALSLMASQAIAKTVAIYDQPARFDAGLHEILAISDMPKDPAECDGKAGGSLAYVQVKDFKGRNMAEFSGCWVLKSRTQITFVTFHQGKWIEWDFATKYFDWI